jgi:hypothetical protein
MQAIRIEGDGYMTMDMIAGEIHKVEENIPCTEDGA